MKKLQEKTTKQQGPVFKVRERKKPFSGRMSPHALALVEIASSKHNISQSEVIESCVIYALDEKKTA